MYGIYYNQLFNSLMISISDAPVVTSKSLGDSNITMLYDKDDNVVGINIFNVSDDIHIHQNFCSFDQAVLDYLTKKLNGVYDFKQQTQFVVGHVLSCEEIEGTHLHKTKVDLGQKEEQIVCGAPNVAKDQFVVVALPGAWMPNGQHIVPGELRGIESNGMICSARELSLLGAGFNETGIIELPADAYKDKVGQDFFKGLDK